jgi:hypothetical protein
VKDIDYFDTFVKQWKAGGGDTITSEVNEVIAKRQESSRE